MTLAGQKLAWGPGGGAPGGSGVLGNRLRSDEHPGAALGTLVGFGGGGGGREAETRKLRALGI